MKRIDAVYWIGFLLLMCAGIVFSQTPKTIPDAAKLKFFKASSEAQAASAQAKAADDIAKSKNAAFRAAVQELQALCGKDDLQLDKAGDPVCIAKPEPPKESKKP